MIPGANTTFGYAAWTVALLLLGWGIKWLIDSVRSSREEARSSEQKALTEAIKGLRAEIHGLREDLKAMEHRQEMKDARVASQIDNLDGRLRSVEVAVGRSGD